MTKSDDSPHGASAFGIPGAANMQELIKSMQSAWTPTGVPHWAPSLDPEELDRRIADLNTVSQWLAVNQNMVQTTIQTLQFQRTAIATMQSFSEAQLSAARTMGQAVGTVDADTPDQPSAPDAPSGAAAAAMPGLNPEQWWQTLQTQFEQIATSALGATGAASTPAKASSKPRKPAASGNASGKSRPKRD